MSNRLHVTGHYNLDFGMRIAKKTGVVEYWSDGVMEYCDCGIRIADLGLQEKMNVEHSTLNIEC